MSASAPVSRAVWRRIFTPVGHPRALTDAHGFLQERVVLYSKTLFGFMVAFSAFGVLKVVGFWLQGGGEYLTRFNYVSLGVFIFFAVGIGLDYLYLRKTRRPMGMLHAYESVGTVVVCGAFSSLVLVIPQGISELSTGFGVMLVLVIRAAIVPSTAVRTALVGIASTLGISTLIWLRVHASPNTLRSLTWTVMLAWGLIFTVVTAIVSRLIYGLQQSVRAAMQLGQYSLEKKLGEGGMGSVYLARHALLRRPTAIKLLPPEITGEATVRRFEREVRETARLSHPNTIEIYDYGHTPEGVFYYAMEYLEGADLEGFVEMVGPLPPGRVIYLLSQAAHALNEAHSEGLIHRDVKPANIMVCEKGGLADMVKVVDFGLVKDIQTPSPALSAANTVTGTPLYMAPEAMLTPDDVDGRTDIYGLGCVAFFMLTGDTVFKGTNMVEVCSHHLHTEPERPSTRLGKPIPADLEAVVLRCLRKKREERYADALELWRALRACESAKSWDQEQARDWWDKHQVQMHTRRTEQMRRVESGSDTMAVDFDRRSPTTRS